MTTTAKHAIRTLNYPGRYGDRPEPWQRVYICTCGEELGFEEEGMSPPILTPEEAFEEHLTGEIG